MTVSRCAASATQRGMIATLAVLVILAIGALGLLGARAMALAGWLAATAG